MLAVRAGVAPAAGLPGGGADAHEEARGEGEDQAGGPAQIVDQPGAGQGVEAGDAQQHHRRGAPGGHEVSIWRAGDMRAKSYASAQEGPIAAERAKRAECSSRSGNATVTSATRARRPAAGPRSELDDGDEDAGDGDQGGHGPPEVGVQDRLVSSIRWPKDRLVSSIRSPRDRLVSSMR